MNKQYLTTDETSAKYFNRTTRGITQQFVGNLLSELKSLKPETILDVGCGTGYITSIMSNELDSTVIGCGMDTNRISFARGNFGQEVIIADITQLPFRDNSFDVVVASEIIEHIHCTEAALTEIERVARKNVVITVPNEPYFRIANFLRGKNVTRFGNPPDHVNHYNKMSLKQVLEAHFHNVEIKTSAIFWIMATVHQTTFYKTRD